MRKARKGFTLVELLIVIAILGALSASMTSSSQKATALAKAQSIVDNVNVCKTAAFLYYSEHRDEDLGDKDASAIFTADYIPNWEEFSSKGIKYSVGTGKGLAGWDVAVDFTGDADVTGIKTALEAIRGYTSSTAKTEIEKGQFNVTLSTGKVIAYAAGTPAQQTEPTVTDPDI